MEVEPRSAVVAGPPERFIGEVWVEGIVAPHEEDQRMTAALVRFAPGARTAWHSHARGQYLRVTAGVARFGDRDGNIVEVGPGETLYTPPGQDHWHASAPGCFMEHLALLENADDPAETTSWKEHVTDEEYAGRHGSDGASSDSGAASTGSAES